MTIRGTLQMNRLLPPPRLCFIVAVLTTSAWAEIETEEEQDIGTVVDYIEAIADIESRQGAYGEGLSETLLATGLTLQSRGQHEDAIGFFKRGVHLARINDGLYSAAQIPLLQGEIASHIAGQNYALADERQRYLYRVQTRGMGSGSALTGAFMQQARWQFEAYQLGLSAQGYTRLMSMWDLYRLALNDVMAREGDKSPNLLPPLRGMLQAQYLISSYEWEKDDSGSSDDVRARQNLHRFTAYRSQSYQKGSAVIAAIHDIEKTAGREQAATETLVMLGDWRLWHDNREAAWDAYRQAETELAQLDDAQSYTEAIFGEPVALPNIQDLRPLPAPVASEQGNILLEFGVNERGKVVDLERLDEDESLDRAAYRLMKTLRRTKFRPRFVTGQPVETEKLVQAYNLQ